MLDILQLFIKCLLQTTTDVQHSIGVLVYNPTERFGRASNTPVSCSKDSGFKSQPGRLTTLFEALLGFPQPL
jgi:hypothetical protein